MTLLPRITVTRSADRNRWTPLAAQPDGARPAGRECTIFSDDDISFTCGLWEREPDSWAFERPYDEVAYILSGAADIETSDGRTLTIASGDVLVTPKGSSGTWRIHDTLTKFYAIYAGGEVGETQVRSIAHDDPVGWIALETPPGDPNPPGEEWYAWRNANGRFSTGVWRRVPETGALERDGFHEISLMIDGQVVIETEDGADLEIGPGDVLVTPDGTEGVWRAKSAVRKFWAVAYVER